MRHNLTDQDIEEVSALLINTQEMAESMVY